MIELQNISYGYADQKLFLHLSLSLPDKQVTSIVGVNGSGKSTLISLFTRKNTPWQGKLLLDHKDAGAMKLSDFAKKVAVLHQENQLFDQIKVQELLELGKLPYENLYIPGKLTVDADLYDLFNLRSLKDKYMANLSGGQKQRVWLAVAMNQRPRYLFLDEPTTYLDLHYQQQLLEKIQLLAHKKGITICMVIHDLNQAMRYSDQIVLLKSGKIFAQGQPDTVLTTKNIKAAFAIDCDIISNGHGEFIVQY